MKPDHGARHEAGHCLMLYRFDVPLGECALAEEGANAGYVDAPPHDDPAMVKEAGASIQILDKIIIPSVEMYVAVAGGVAGRIYERNYPSETLTADQYVKAILGSDCCNDLTRIRCALKRQSCRDAETYVFIKRICASVKATIEQHETGVEAVAKALVEKTKLSGEQVRRILDKFAAPGS